MACEITEHEVCVRLTKDRKLPHSIPCPFCYGAMRRLFFRRGVTYRCSECDVDTTLDPSELKKSGLR